MDHPFHKHFFIILGVQASAAIVTLYSISNATEATAVFYLVFIPVILIGFYFFFGWKLPLQESKIKDFFYVSGLIPVLFLLWLFCLYADDGSMFSSFIWFFYFAANPVSILPPFLLDYLVKLEETNIHLFTFTAIFLPSFFIWISMQIKRRSLKDNKIS